MLHLDSERFEQKQEESVLSSHPTIMTRAHSRLQPLDAGATVEVNIKHIIISFLNAERIYDLDITRYFLVCHTKFTTNLFSASGIKTTKE